MLGFSARGRAVRVAAGLLTTGVFAIGSTLAVAGTALADQNGGATATLGDFLHAGRIDVDGGVAYGGTVALQDGGQQLAVYCIDLHHDTHDGVQYQETGWAQSTLSQNPDRGKIQWILQHSFPVVSAATLAGDIGASGLTDDQAAAATQAAIWHYSDHVDAQPENGTAAQLTAWLEQHAQDTAEPAPSLALSPASVAGRGGLLGPVTVATSGSSVDVSLTGPSGVRLVDAAGKPVTSAVNGEKLYVDVPKGTAAGSAEVDASTTTALPVGRAFKAVDGSSQTMILAGTAPVSVKAAAQARWAPQGPVPAANATQDCKQGGVDITLTNGGDQPWTARVGALTETVAPGATKTVLVKEKEGQKYTITVTGPNFTRTFTGALTCQPTGGSHLPSPTPTPSASSSQPPLAETGASSATPVIAGIGAGLVVVGGAAVFLLRKRRGNHSA
ncbi:thioester domain-containing protein [Streptacidiphilus neutrinimicus]|uniref:thioester domain-containing protein n=1 Tax=Streptacidiphilus neutrinimicus TaxID=105420 RepID=UPI0005A605B7|nr:thioester domain-containing protein [Streptacidiphilus neutrinimicus]